MESLTREIVGQQWATAAEHIIIKDDAQTTAAAWREVRDRLGLRLARNSNAYT